MVNLMPQQLLELVQVFSIGSQNVTMILAGQPISEQQSITMVKPTAIFVVSHY
jgi:hypothetical protein